MANYFRITAYHPQKDISAILDSNGKFEKLWQFSAYLIQKGFKIIEVGNEEKFTEGNIPLITERNEKILLRASAKGKPQQITTRTNGIAFQKVQVNELYYLINKYLFF